MESKVAEVAERLLAKSTPGKAFNLVSEFAVPFPGMVIAEMLGVPPDDWEDFKLWSDNETGQSEFTSSQERRNVHLGFVRYFEKKVEERKLHPREDLISSIVSSKVDGDNLALPDILSFCMLLLVGGIETATNLISSGIRHFIKYGSFNRLRERPASIPSAVEEVLRYTSPVRMMGRHAMEDTVISEREIKKGQGVVAWLGSANRDDSMFPRPDEFDIERNPNPHIAFGHGIHMCIGAPLARMEAKVAFEVLLKRFGRVEFAVPESSIEPIRNVNVCGVKELPIILST